MKMFSTLSWNSYPVGVQILVEVLKKYLFSTMCSACAERDVPLGRDVCFASDVRFAREDAEHITSLCDGVAIHHYGEATTSLRLAATSLLILRPQFPTTPCNLPDFMLY